MKIYPSTGIDDVTFGMMREEVKAILGLPNKINNPEGQDLCTSEEWIYSELGLELSFDPDMEFRFNGCYINSKIARLDDVCLIGLNEHQLVEKLPYLILDVNSDKYQEYIYPNTEMCIVLMDKVVKCIQIYPNSDEFSNKYDPRFKIYKRIIANRKLTKKWIRKSENTFVSQLLSTWDKNDKESMLNLQSDFEWFLTARLTLDVFPEEMWCDGTIIKSVKYSSEKLLFINATADILSSNDDTIYQVHEVEGFINLDNNRKKMKKYKFTFRYDDQVYIARKGCN